LSALPEEAMAPGSNPWQARGLTGAWSRPVIGEVQDGSPASLAGLKRGDEVLRIEGRVVNDAIALRAMVRASGQHVAPAKQTWEIARGHERLLIEVQPQQVLEGQQHMGRIGAQVGETPATVWVQLGVWDGVAQAIDKTWHVMGMTIDMLGRLLTGQASLDQLSGPLGMADYAGRSADLGLGPYLSYLALLSISLGVFNLLPFPMLDGGHLLYYLYEACTGHPPSAAWLDVMQRVGLVVLVVLMVFSLFNDVVRLGWLP
jgi:regulator of sigma E protease